MTRKVCLVGPVYPFRGGIAHFTSILAGEFARTHEVFVVNFRRLYPSFLFPGRTQYDESGSPLVVESERIIDSLNPISFWRTARAIAAFDPDLVVFQWWQPFFAVAYSTILFFLRRSSSTRAVFLCHNVLPHESSPIDRLLIRMAFKQVDRFLVQSNEDRSNLFTLKKGARAEVHPHPIYDVFKRGKYTRDSARAELGISGRVLLFFGYIRPYKGVDVLLDGFAKSLGHVKSTLLIVGEFYEDKGRYLDRIDELDIAGDVSIVDRYVPNEEVEKYFCASDVVVLPYHSATQSGIVQVAFAFDRPVIVTAVGGLPDVVEDGVSGFVVPPKDADALSDAICRMLDGNTCEKMERNVAAVKDRFSWSACKEILIGLGEEGSAAR